MEKLLWIDMEMSGLDVNREVIIEVAAIVTDLNLKEIESYSAVVYQDQKYIDAMDDWNRKTHRDSGLIEMIPKGKRIETIETELLSLLDQHFSKERAVLAGNSIGQDRLFIDKYLRSFSSRLHYRMLDVTSWKIMLKEKYKIEYDKKNRHRAIDDIRESMGELQHYLTYFEAGLAALKL